GNLLFNWRRTARATSSGTTASAERAIRRDAAASGGTSSCGGRQAGGVDRDRPGRRDPPAGGCLRQRTGLAARSDGVEGEIVIQIAAGTKVYLACRPVSMRYGFDGLAARSYMSMPLLVRLTDSEVQ